MKIIQDTGYNDIHPSTGGGGTYISLETYNALKAKYETARNELCLWCGKHKESHLGACRGCRWEER